MKNKCDRETVRVVASAMRKTLATELKLRLVQDDAFANGLSILTIILEPERDIARMRMTSTVRASGLPNETLATILRNVGPFAVIDVMEYFERQGVSRDTTKEQALRLLEGMRADALFTPRQTVVACDDIE